MMAKKNVLVLLGPNLNMVGIREKGVYGNESEESIERQIREEAEKLGYHCEIFQSNWEGALIDKIHEARESYQGVILNAGALTHYSYALRDAIASVPIPFVEGPHEQHPRPGGIPAYFRDCAGVRRPDLRLWQKQLFFWPWLR